MEDMVDFFYSGKIEISELNVQDLLHIACLLQVQSVKKACCEFLKRQLSPENCIGKLLLWYPHVELHKVWHYIQKTSDNNEMQWGILNQTNYACEHGTSVRSHATENENITVCYIVLIVCACWLVEYCALLVNRAQLQMPSACLLQTLQRSVRIFCFHMIKQLRSSDVNVNWNRRMIIVFQSWFVGICALADAHSCRELLSTSELFARNHFVEVVQGEEFMDISAKQLARLVLEDELGVHSEERVFEAVMAWIKYDIQGRQVKYSHNPTMIVFLARPRQAVFYYSWKTDQFANFLSHY